MDVTDLVKNGFKGRHIAVIGDVVADQFLTGTISRVSREAPVFILKHEETVTLPGAAANAAGNVASLGARSTIVGVVGQDANAELLKVSLEARNVDTGQLVQADGFATTTKVRVLAGHHYAARQQVIRIDYEAGADLDEALKSSLLDRARNAAKRADAVIISDYGYGAIWPELFEDLRSVASERRVPLITDSRFRLQDFKGATAATPNREEVEQILGRAYTEAACTELRDELGLEALLVTNGNKGMTLFEQGRTPIEIHAVGSTEPVDVTGAGDTVIAVFALGLASGCSFREAAEIANHAGGLVVMKKGTETVTAAELSDSLRPPADALALAQ